MLRTLPEAVNAAIRVFAPVMIGLALLCFIASGCWVSSTLLATQGLLWTSTTASIVTLAEAMAASQTVAGNGCCGGPLAILRNLAIACIVFACVEISLALGFGIGVGVNSLLQPISGAQAGNGEGVSFSTCGMCVTNFGFGCNGCGACGTAPFPVGGGFPNPLFNIGVWLTVYTGTTAIGGAFNIAMSVATLKASAWRLSLKRSSARRQQMLTHTAPPPPLCSLFFLAADCYDLYHQG